MTQNDLNRAVAERTGETVDQIRRMGFSLVTLPTHALPKRSRKGRSMPRWFRKSIRRQPA